MIERHGRRPARRVWHAALALALAWGVFAFGAVYSWAFWPLAIASAVCGLAGMAVRRREEGGRAAHDPPPATDGVRSGGAAGTHGSWPPALVWSLAAVAGAIALQLVPLPIDLMAAISPRAPRLLAELDIPFAAGLATRHEISIAPAATTTALALFASFAILMLGVSRAASVAGPRRIAAIVCAIGVLVALVGIVQKPLYAGRIYGFWAPLMPASRPFGPFVNPNHFAGWMLMALPLTFGLLCAVIARAAPAVPRGWRERILWLSSREASGTAMLGAAAVVMALSLVLTMSRSGMAAFALGVAITSWFAVRRLPGNSTRALVSAYLLGVVVLVVGCVGGETIVARFGDANPANVNERLPIWRDTWPMVRDFWLTGTGLNTYGVATLFYQTAMPEFHLREAHNEYLQIAAEGGLLVSIPAAAALMAFAIAVRRRFDRSRGSSYWIRLGAVTGIVAIALQSTVEFSLQMPGNAALFAVLCGIALHDPVAGGRRGGGGGVEPGLAARADPPAAGPAGRLRNRGGYYGSDR